MFPTELPKKNTDEFSRCEERGQRTDLGKTPQNDAAIKEAIYQALWKDNVLRAIEYYEIDVHVKNKTVYLYGHIVGTVSQLRIMNALRVIPDILGIISHLVLDDRLILEVATSLGQLEHAYGCKFFTGASHGVVSLNGTVTSQNIKSLAEICVASNPNVRGVLNNVRILGIEPEAQGQPLSQPAIGETIYFTDGVSRAVKQVVINPNNRRVIAMIVRGSFSELRNVTHPLSDGTATPHEQFIVVPIETVRYLTKVSGFLYINSNERNRYTEFNIAHFFTPKTDWTPPYPYCLGDVLFPVEYQTADIQMAYGPYQFPFKTIPDNKPINKQFFSNDSLGV